MADTEKVPKEWVMVALKYVVVPAFSAFLTFVAAFAAFLQVVPSPAQVTTTAEAAKEVSSDVKGMRTDLTKLTVLVENIVKNNEALREENRELRGKVENLDRRVTILEAEKGK